MKRGRAITALGVVLAACLLAPLAGSAAGPADVVCAQDTQSFSGTARNLIVPAGGFCAVANAAIAHDLVLLDEAGAELDGTSVGHDVRFGEFAGGAITNSSIGHDIVAQGTDSGADITDSTVGHDFVGLGEESGTEVLRSTIGHDLRLLGAGGGTHLESVTIGHDLYAASPQTVQTGHNSPFTPGGPVKVGHDFTIEGGPDSPFVFDGLCNLNVARDLRIVNRTVTLGIGVGDICAGNGQPANTVGRDLVVEDSTATAGFFGPSSIRVGANHVGRNLVFTGNTADGATLQVFGNVVGGNATCEDNDPAVTAPSPNIVAGTNTCG
jgi:hypothetical protein